MISAFATQQFTTPGQSQRVSLSRHQGVSLSLFQRVVRCELCCEFLTIRGPEGPLNLNADAQNSA